MWVLLSILLILIIWKHVINLKHALIFFNHSILKVRIKEDFRFLDNLLKCQMLNFCLNFSHCILVWWFFWIEVDCQWWSFDCCCNIDDFFESWNSQCNILCWDTCRVKCVQSHLSCWFSNRLCSYWPDTFSWMNSSSIKLLLYLSNDPSKSIKRKLLH